MSRVNSYRVTGFFAAVLAGCARTGQYIQPLQGATEVVPGRNPLVFGVSNPQVAIAAPRQLTYTSPNSILNAANMAVAGQSIKLNNQDTFSNTATTDMVLQPDNVRPAAGTASMLITKAFGFRIRIHDSSLNFKPGAVNIALGLLNSTGTTDSFTLQYYFTVWLRTLPCDIVAFFINNNGGKANIIGQDIKRINASGGGAVLDSTPAILVTNSGSTNVLGKSSVVPNSTQVAIETLNAADLEIMAAGAQDEQDGANFLQDMFGGQGVEIESGMTRSVRDASRVIRSAR